MTKKFTQLDADRINAKNTPKSSCPANAFDGPESDLHSMIEAELIRRRWYYVHSRTDRPTTQRKGVPDFIIAAPKGITYWVEVKRKNGKLTQDQTITKHVLGGLDHKFFAAYSMEDFLREIEKLNK